MTLGRFDSRSRSARFSLPGAASRPSSALGYMPVVRSAVVDEDQDWQGLKRHDAEPRWDDETPDEETVPSESLAPEAELPLPSDDELPLPSVPPEPALEDTLYALLQAGRSDEVVTRYRALRAGSPELVPTERLLVLAVEAADRTGDAAALFDAAKLIAHAHPESAYAARVLSRVAEQQVSLGRSDLARATFAYVLERYPDDAIVQAVRARLAAL